MRKNIMEPLSSQHREADLSQLLTEYKKALKDLSPGSQLSSRQALRVLRTRDRIQSLLSKTPHIDDDYLEKLLGLDLDLRKNATLICQSKHFEQLRQNLEPPASFWWWYLEPLPVSSRSKSILGRFDWLWNVGTVACLVIATSFITQTARAFSTEGFDFLGTLSTISQGAGLVFVAGGALTDKGKQAVGHILSSIRIPTSLHAEATFAASLLLLVATYGVNQNLHLVGNWYFDQAKSYENQGEFSQAFKTYQRSLNFSPDDYRTQISIGFLHERLGNFEQAVEAYQKGTAFGIPEFLNAQARAMLMGELQKNNWQGSIDSEVIRQARDLLNRADKSVFDFTRELGEIRQDKRLGADIRVNLAIAAMAGFKFEEQLAEESQPALAQVAKELESIGSFIQKQTENGASPLTAASTLGIERAECFYQKAFPIGWASDSPIVFGMDQYMQIQEEIKACLPFRFDPSLYTTPDALFLRNYQFLDAFRNNPFSKEISEIEITNLFSFTKFLSEYLFHVAQGGERPDYADNIILIQEPDVWLTLANQLSRSIQENFSPADNQKDIIVWRFLLDRSGETIAYFAYGDASKVDESSLTFATQTLQKETIEKLGSELTKGGKLEFVDFKVVLSKEGKILHLLPWQMAYTTSAIKCQKLCESLLLNPNVHSVFRSYTPDLQSASELSALKDVVTQNSYFLEFDDDSGIYNKEPAIFKLKVSSDGQITGHQAINQVAIQKFKRRPPFSGLDKFQFPDLQRPPYADFRLELRGIFPKLELWSDSE